MASQVILSIDLLTQLTFRTGCSDFSESCFEFKPSFVTLHPVSKLFFHQYLLYSCTNQADFVLSLLCFPILITDIVKAIYTEDFLVYLSFQNVLSICISKLTQYLLAQQILRLQKRTSAPGCHVGWKSQQTCLLTVWWWSIMASEVQGIGSLSFRLITDH